ncbi:MAG: PepSY domain-containing protein [Hahellaceae bacterium]|nr:PepSY domain-containing protein [Hahellaceae bacterium]MCP5170446.1 PepSY domain-containing protein [Hahellaceae bacterium]
MLKSRTLLLSAFSALSLMTAQAFADPQCTDAPQNQWQNPETFQQSLKAQGYEIKKFKQTKTNCYEIYGHNNKGQRVEIYFNPVNGEAVKTEIED